MDSIEMVQEEIIEDQEEIIAIETAEEVADSLEEAIEDQEETAEEMAVILEGMTEDQEEVLVGQEKCIKQFVLNVAMNAKYLSSHQETDLFIAKIVLIKTRDFDSG